MKGRSELWRAVHQDLVDKCAATAPQTVPEEYIQYTLRYSRTVNDFKTVQRRVKTEGESFFGITLPSFGKEFLQALDRGCIPPNSFVGWSHTSYSGIYPTGAASGPRFLSWAIETVFNASHVCSAEPNVLHPCLVGGIGQAASLPGRYFTSSKWYDDDWAAECVHAILQLSGLYSKEKRLASDARNLAALDAYVATDRQLSTHLEEVDFPLLSQRLHDAKKVMSLAFARVLSYVDREVYEGLLLPKHGPGATADKLYGNQKWLLTEWTERMDKLFNHEEFLYANDVLLRESDDSVRLLTPEEERPVKVILVPKTQKTPRVIAIEPTCMQYVQQAFMRTLVPRLEHNKACKGFVGFTDQDPNRRMAAYGSVGGGLATLDLSEASDRVSNWLVEAMFQDFPHFLEGIQACRSTRAGLPDGRVIDLQKFASMGSALTFPIEGIVFATISLAAVCRALSLPLSVKSLRSLRGRVRVYGDDIIVPEETAEQVADDLELFGFKVNRNKSFWTGEYRESCGEEYWRGRDVSHIKVRTSFPTSLRNATEVLSTSSTRNQLFEAGFVSAVELLDEILLKVLRGRYPIVESTSPLVGRLALDRPHADGWDENLHVPVAVGYVSTAKIPDNPLDGARALLKFFLSPSEDEDHLARSGRPRVVRMKLVKAPVF